MYSSAASMIMTAISAVVLHSDVSNSVLLLQLYNITTREFATSRYVTTN